jgi:hypothetical protein
MYLRVMRAVVGVSVGALRASALLAPALLGGCGGDRLVLGGGGDSSCVPGLYLGSYTCTQDGSAPLSPQGNVSIVLQGDRGAASLSVAPGTTLSGSPPGTHFVMPLTGTVDCTTYEFKGALGNVDVSTGGSHFTLYESVPMTARYDGDASPPAMVGGTWTAPQAQALIGGPCQWSASLQP